MLHPNQFRINDTWIVFQVNDTPIATESDGHFNVIALMDAATCFIVGTASVPAHANEPSQLDAKRLLKSGQSQAKQWPRRLFIPSDMLAHHLETDAVRQGITVERIPEAHLEVFIGDAKQSFTERLSGVPSA